tara:strand:+ start:799 stop:1287 length:489 start_codon:yes stop_codon:yes gene_type:complete
MSLQEEQDLFKNIIDPDTNQQVLLESECGQQVLKNYLECLQNGPDSPNILSTKMFYENDPESPPQELSTSIGNIYEFAKKLDSTQYKGRDLKKLIAKSKKKTPTKGNKIWIRRSSGKWQRGIISSVIFDDESDSVKCDVFINAGDNNIASKKGLDVNEILLY